MTRREIFLLADPHVVYDRIGFEEIDMDGHIERFPFKRPFYICKGLNWFANGELYDIPKKVVLDQIIKSNSKFQFAELQLKSLYQNREATLYAAVEALGLSNRPKVDDSINQWLDHVVSFKNDDDINSMAASIISGLIKKQEEAKNDQSCNTF